MGRRLYVGNLNYNTDEQTLKTAFSHFGEVKEVKVVMDRETGRARGFAFVEFMNDADAANAITQMNGQDVDGRALRVNEAEDRRAGGGGGGGSGYRPPPRDNGGPPKDFGGPPPDGGGGGGGGRGGKSGGRSKRGRDRDERW